MSHRISVIGTLIVSSLVLGCNKTPAPTSVPLTPATVAPTEVVAPTATEPAPPAPPPKPDRKLLLNQVNDAVALLTLGSTEATKRALKILKSVVEQDSTLAYAHFNVGVAHQQLNELGAARMAYDRALEHDDTLSKAWLAMGLLMDISGSPSKAIVKYRQGLDNAPDDIELHVALIGSLRRQNRLGEAINAAKAALKINANSLAIYNELGLVYVGKNDLNMARFVYLKAKGQVDGGQNNASIRCNLGRVLYLQNEAAQAERELLEAYSLDNKYFSTLVYLSEIHFDNRAYEKAVPLLEEARRQQPEHHGVAMNLGLAYRGSGRFDDSKRLYEEAIRIDQTNSDPYLNLGILFGDYLKQYDESIESFNTYISMGGVRKQDAVAYVAKVEKERQRASKKKAQDAERKRREAERAERERILREAEEKAKAEESAKSNDPWGSGEAPATSPDGKNVPDPQPSEDQEPATPSPWENP